MRPSEKETTLATIHALLTADGLTEAADLVRKYPARAEEVGYDNWNGGTAFWEVYFEVPPAEYARMEQCALSLRSK